MTFPLLWRSPRDSYFGDCLSNLGLPDVSSWLMAGHVLLARITWKRCVFSVLHIGRHTWHVIVPLWAMLPLDHSVKAASDTCLQHKGTPSPFKFMSWAKLPWDSVFSFHPSGLASTEDFLPEIFFVMVEAKWWFSQFRSSFNSPEWHWLLRKRDSFLVDHLTDISVGSLIVIVGFFPQWVMVHHYHCLFRCSDGPESG